MMKVAGLQAAGTNKEVFAKHLGRRVQVIGTEPAGRRGMFLVTRIAPVSGRCGQK